MKINFLKIYTTNLEQQLEFYRNVLLLPVERISEDLIEVGVGYSTLQIQEKSAATPYHIAFHIFARQEEQALEWLKARVAILKNGEEEIVDFSNWKAKSIYFYDADKNVLEFISRRHLFPQKTQEFSEKSITGISEIGLACSNVKKAFDFLNWQFSLEKFTGDYERFCAIGNDDGLFIAIDKNKKDWFPSSDKAFSSDFEIRFSTGSKTGNLSYTNERLELL